MQVREYTLTKTGHRYVMRFWECRHFDPTTGTWVSEEAAPPEWHAAPPDSPPPSS